MRVYCISGYPEELISVAFAKTSRSYDPFDEIIKELDEEKSSKFHEKWVVGYGHKSVAEHAVVHIACERISRLSVEYIERTRLGSYTERSTRYQVIEENDFYVPELPENLSSIYKETIGALYRGYKICHEKLTAHYGGNEKARLATLDSARYLLPNATLANVGITMNARVLEHTISRMLGSELKEVREIGERMRVEANKLLPTLMKHVQPSPHKKFEGLNIKSNGKDVILVDYDKDAIEKFLTCSLYAHSHADYRSVKEYINALDEEKKAALLSSFTFDREAEHIWFLFDILMDQGAYCEFKRHRMCTITTQPPTVDNGYAIPADIASTCREEFVDGMRMAEECFKKMGGIPEAGYIMTNAHKRRVLVFMNLRELNHFVKLRTKKGAHFSIKEIALNMLEEVKQIYPSLKIEHI